MLDKLKNANKVVGTRRLVRAIQAGEIAEAYIGMPICSSCARCARPATRPGYAWSRWTP